MSETQHESAPAGETSRRGFLGATATVVMACGLAGGYGAIGAMAARYLYPAADRPKGWMFAARLDQIAKGGALLYKAPSGEPINIARHGPGVAAEDFIALSSVCPHLGCQVYWEGDKQRFFCPCHNGVFDGQGHGTGGPPKGQDLLRYHLKVENGLLFVEVPLDSLNSGGGRA